MNSVIRDVHFAVRSLRKSPGFALTAIASIALAITLTLSLFEFFHALSFEAPAIANPAQVVAIYGQNKIQPYMSTSWPDYLDARSRQTAFSGLAAYIRVKATLRQGSTNIEAWGEMSSANYFTTLGLQPALGRFFLAAEETSGRPVAIIGYDLWQHSYGGSPSAIGSTLWLNQHAFSIIGVAPRQFAGVVLDWGGVPQFWVASCQQSVVFPNSDLLTNRKAASAVLVARLRPNVPLKSAQADLSLIARQLGQSSGDPSYNFVLLPLSRARYWPAYRDGIQHKLQMLLLLAVCVLIVACTNVAALLFARSAVRRGEIALRSAVGATRGRLIRQLLTESMFVSAIGGLAGIVLSWTTLRATEQLNRLFPIPLHVHLHLNATVVLLGLAMSLASGLLFGFVPALLLTRNNLQGSLAATQRTVFGERNQSIWLLRAVVIQIAVCCAVAFTTLLLGRSLWKQITADRGIHPKGVFCADFALRRINHRPDLERELYRQLLTRIENLPAVQSASLDSGPFNARISIRTEPTPESPQEQVAVQSSRVSSQYFHTLGIPLLKGKTFSSNNSTGNGTTDAEVIVSQTLAQELWPDQDPTGKHLYLSGGNSPAEVVGVASDVLRGAEQAPIPFLYTSIYSNPVTEATLYLRSRFPDRDAGLAIKSAFAQIDPEMVVENAESLRARLNDRNAQAVTLSALVAVFAAIALLLAFVGIYALVAFEVTARRHSTAIRLALGETRAGILYFFLHQALRLCGIGLLAGLPPSILLSSLFRQWFWKITQTDSISILSVVVLLAAVTLSASLVPALTASRTNPAKLLRDEY
ncbi:MAG TPA: ADOP family duplicated permease [Terracidiphilus sp.]|jgi:putative ABC transport system permease protein